MKFWDSSALVPLLVEEEPRFRYVISTSANPGSSPGGARPSSAPQPSLVSNGRALSPQETTEASNAWMPWPGTGIASSRWTPCSRPPGACSGFILSALPTPSNSPPLSRLRGRPSTLELVCLDDRLVIAAQRKDSGVIAPGFEVPIGDGYPYQDEPAGAGGLLDPYNHSRLFYLATGRVRSRQEARGRVAWGHWTGSLADRAGSMHRLEHQPPPPPGRPTLPPVLAPMRDSFPYY